MKRCAFRTLAGSVAVALAIFVPGAAASGADGSGASTAASEQAPDGDGGNPGLPEPGGVGAPAGADPADDWTVSTRSADGSVVTMDDFPGDSATSTSGEGFRAAGSWWDGQCGSNSSTADKFDVLKQYNRPRPHSRMSGSKAKMYCGKNVSTQSESAFGLRHIRAGHKSQFAALSALEGRDWGNFMHWSTSWVLSEPGWRTVQNADRFCYQKRFDFRSPSGSSFNRQVVVILGRTGVRIMTAFPSSNSDYCQGTRF